MKYKDPQSGNFVPFGVKIEDTLPVGTEVDYDGNDVPEGWEEILEDDKVIVSPTEPTGNNRKKIWVQHSKNLFNGNSLGTTTVANVTATPNGSKITFNGTTNSAGKSIYTTQYLGTLKAGTYILSATVESGTASNEYSISLRNSDGSKIENEGTSFTLANDQPVYFRFYVANNGTVFDNLVLKLQLEPIEPDATATTYEDFVDNKIYILNNEVYEEFIQPSDIYSMGEQKIGIWLDGKPLYRRIFTQSISGETLYQIDIDATFNVVRTHAQLYNPSMTFPSLVNVPYYVNSSSYCIGNISGTRYAYQGKGSSFNNGTLTVMIEYTKTTD